jgi:hypothetical protein
MKMKTNNIVSTVEFCKVIKVQNDRKNKGLDRLTIVHLTG